MKSKQRLAMIETDNKHIEATLDKLVEKLDSLQTKIYLGMGIFMAFQILISSGIIKIGV